MNKLVMLLCLALASVSPAAEEAVADPLRLRAQTALNAIGPELLAAHLRNDGMANTMVSSASLFWALSVLALGADGDTAALLDARLLTDRDAPLTEVAPQLAALLTTEGGGHARHGAFQLSNSVWSTNGASDGAPFVLDEAFIAAAERLYGAVHRSLDFAAPGASEPINAWAEETTNGLIPTIIDDKLLSGLDWVILNTALFEGSWGTAMRRKDASDDYRFVGLDGHAQAAETINTVDYVARVADLDDGSVVFQLPFAGGRYAFIAHLPAADQADIPAWLQDAAVPGFAGVAARLLAGEGKGALQQLSIRLPVFDFNDSVSMSPGSPIARALGLAPLFEPGADFSRLSATPSRVDIIKQDTRIELDEKGVRAAAATLIGGVRATTVQPSYSRRVIVVDRPFAFGIVERGSQALLFNGVVVSLPAKE